MTGEASGHSMVLDGDVVRGEWRGVCSLCLAGHMLLAPVGTISPSAKWRKARMEGAVLIAAWRETINGSNKSWVLFENGTCVILMEPEADLVAQAVALLQEFGPVHAGSSAGDFTTITLDNGRGWVVACHHNDIPTFVGPEEVSPDAEDLMVGLLGRSKRGQDAEELRLVHVEDKRHTDQGAVADRPRE